jgi:RNA polymerase sigma-70 factor (ECF subfamily)
MAKDDVPDSELIAQTRAGKTDAFRVLVHRYEPVVAATVLGMLGRCPEAQDVGQQVFIRFYRAIDDFRGEASLKTYLTRIAINLSLNELKRRKRNRVRFTTLDDGFNGVDTVDGPARFGPARFATTDDTEIEKREKSRIVRGAIERLDEPFRTVVILRMMHGYSVKETAQMLEIPTGTVLSRLARAQKKLAAILAPYVTT